MSYQVNQRITPYQQQPTMGLNADPLQNVDTEKIVNDSPMTKATKQDNPALLLGVMVPTVAGLAIGMSKFSESCRGEYKNTALGKIEAFGNKIGNLKVFNNTFVKGIQNKAKALNGFFKNKIIAKNKILYAMYNTRSQPTNKMVLTMYGGIDSELAGTAAQMFEKYVKDGGKLSIKEIAADGKEIVRDLTDAEIKEITQNSAKPGNIEKIIKVCEQKALNNEAYIVTKGGKIPKIFGKEIFGKEIYLSESLSFTKRLFCKEVHFSEFLNKLKGANGTGIGANSTAIGKALPRQSLRILEGLTNASTGGSIIGAVMGAYIIADAIVKSIKAPKDEKGKTFAENIIYNLGWYLTMPLGLKAMHSIGGLQYIGMKKEGKGSVEEYRKELNTHNEKAIGKEIGVGNSKPKADAKIVEGFKDKAEYNLSEKKLKDMLKGDTKKVEGAGFVKNGVRVLKNILYRPLKFVGRLFTSGLETIRPFIPKTPGKLEKFFSALGMNGTKVGKFFRNLGFNLKNGTGSVTRFGVFMFLIAPFLGKIAAKCSHIVFGRPTKSVLDEGKEEKEKEKQSQMPVVHPTMPQSQAEMQSKPQSVMNPTQQQSGGLINSQTPNNSANNSTISGQRTNMIDMYQPNPTTQKTMTTPQGPVRTYIPSAEGVKIQPDENQNKEDSKVTAVLNKANNAELVANRFIH